MSQTAKPQRILWGRIGLEVAVIVVSILFAFGIDAWWQSLGDRTEEQEILAGLLEEFEEHRAHATTRLERNDRTWQGIQRLQELRGAAIRDPDQAIVVAEALRAISFTSGPTGLRGSVLLALVGSGRLELIQDRDLREALSRWEFLAATAEEQARLVANFVMEQLFPHIASLDVPLDEAFSARPDGLFFGDLVVGDPGEYQALVRDREFYNLLAIRRLWLTGTHLHYTAAWEESGRILEMIRRNLDR